MTELSRGTKVTGGAVQGIVGAETASIRTLTIYNYYDRAPPVQRAADDTARTPPCPYPGLSYFGPEQSESFYGRERAIGRLVEAVKQQSFTALVGPSGSGKSSVVLAGVAPRLATSGDWVFSYFRIATEIDSNPFRALSSALVPIFSDDQSPVRQLRDVEALAEELEAGTVKLPNVLGRCLQKIGGKRFLLIADQFEEVFTLISDRNRRERFCDLLLSGFGHEQCRDRPNVSLIITLRADFYSIALRYRPLSDALQGRVENLGPMTLDELREAIEKPARDVAFEAGLVNTLVDDVANRPGSLPLLQFALRELWLRQEHACMTHDAYEAIGRVDGALAKRAEDIFRKLTAGGGDKDRVRLFRRLFTRLVTPGKGVEDTRRVVGRAELGEDVWQLAQKLADEGNRLLVTSATSQSYEPSAVRQGEEHDGAGHSHETAEIVHEALIRNWPTLVGWINRDREFLSWLEQIKPRVEEWKGSPADAGTLLSGGPLSVAEDWLNRRGIELSESERSFVEASLAARKRQQHRLLAYVGLISLSAIILIAGLIYYAARSRTLQDQAESQASLALQNQSLFLGRQSGEEAAKGNIDLSLLLALEALPKNLDVQERPLLRQAETALTRTVFAARRMTKVKAHASSALSLVVAPDERWLLSGGADGTLSAYSMTRTGVTPVSVGHRMDGAVVAAGVNNNGDTAVTASITGSVSFLETSAWKLHKTVKIESRPTCVAFDPKGTTIAICTASGEIVLFDGRGNQRGRLQGGSETITAGKFDSTGARFAGSARDGSVHLWDVGTRALSLTILAGDSEVWDLDLGRGGNFVVTASDDGLARLWNAKTGEFIRAFEGHRGPGSRVMLDEESDVVVTAGADGDIIVWNLSDGSKSAILGGNSGGVESIHLRAGEPLIVAADKSGDIRAWNWIQNRIESTYKPHLSDVRQIAYLPRSRTIVSIGNDGQMVINRLDNIEFSRTKMGSVVQAAAFADGRGTVVLGFWDGGVEFWNPMSGMVAASPSAHNGPVISVHSPHCMKGPVTVSSDGVIRLWETDMKTSTAVRTARAVDGIRIDRACKMAAVLFADSSMQIIALPSGVIAQELPRSNDVVTALEFDPQGTIVVTGDASGRLTVWSTATGSRLASVQGHADRVVALAFAQGGLVSAGWDGALKVWSIGDSSLTNDLNVSGDPIATMKAEAASVVVGRWNGQLELWRLDPLVLQRRWSGHRSSVASLDYLEHQELLVSGASDGTISLWDTHSGEALAQFPRRESDIEQTTFTANGTWILSRSVEGDVRISRAVGDLKSLVAEALSFTKRDLSDAERANFGITLVRQVP